MRPNIVFMLIDDMGWRDLGCYGSTFYETPAIDKLAAEGMLFTDAYASCPVCSPTRASVMTGKYPAEVGITNWIGASSRGKLIDAPYIDHLPLSEKSVAAALRENGYETWHVGKWHLGKKDFYPEKHGFDVNIGGCDWGHPKKGYFPPYGIETLSDGPEGEYLTDRLTDEAIKLIQNRKAVGAQKPFFLNFWHYTVHTPIQAKPEDIRYFEQKAKRLKLDGANPFVEGDFFPMEHKRDKRIERRVIQSNPVYAAMIYNLDQNVQRLLDAIEAAGETENTLFIFTSDNGGLATAENSPTCNLPLAEGKGWMYDGGVREPLIAKWPGHIRPGSRCGAVTTTPDFYPTFLEAAGATLMPEQHTSGVSILPLLEETGTLDRDAVFWHYPHYGNQGSTPGSSIRAGDYKLIEFFEDSHVELYNLAHDISETFDLSKKMPELAEKLRRRLAEWRESVEAKIPEVNPEWPAGRGE